MRKKKYPACTAVRHHVVSRYNGSPVAANRPQCDLQSSVCCPLELSGQRPDNTAVAALAFGERQSVLQQAGET